MLGLGVIAYMVLITTHSTIKVDIELLEFTIYVQKLIKKFLKAIIGQRHVAIQIQGLFPAKRHKSLKSQRAGLYKP